MLIRHFGADWKSKSSTFGVEYYKNVLGRGQSESRPNNKEQYSEEMEDDNRFLIKKK